jgi:hypothetical protein
MYYSLSKDKAYYHWHTFLFGSLSICYFHDSCSVNEYNGYRRIYRVFTNGLAPCMLIVISRVLPLGHASSEGLGVSLRNLRLKRWVVLNYLG